MVLGVGYRKQCEEKAVQCLSRLNIGLGAGTGRLQKRWGRRLSSAAVALAAAVLHPPCPGRAAPPDPPRAPPQHRWASPVTHIPVWGSFLLVPITSPRIVPPGGAPIPIRWPRHAHRRTHHMAKASAALHHGSGRSLVLPLTRTTSGASTSLKPVLLWAKPHNASSASPFTSHHALRRLHRIGIR